MLRVLFLVAALAGEAMAEDIVEYAMNGTVLHITVKGTAYREITITGSKQGGGQVAVKNQSPNYVIGQNIVSDIVVYVHISYRASCNGINLNYADHATVPNNDAFRFNVYACSGSHSFDMICTGGQADHVDAYGGTNFIATGRGLDFINTEDESYVFTGEGGLAGVGPPPYGGDYVYWEGACAVYTANGTQAAWFARDVMDPWYAEDGSGDLVEGLYVSETGPLTGWN